MNTAANLTATLPRQGGLLALDHSRAATGVAIASFELGAARALTALRERDESTRLEALARLVAEWQPVLLVLGLPLDVEGGEQPQSRRARRFARRLEQRFRLPVVLHDERWSTAAAEANLRAAGARTRQLERHGDAEAAREILQAYLDACRRADGSAAVMPPRTGS